MTGRRPTPVVFLSPLELRERLPGWPSRWVKAAELSGFEAAAGQMFLAADSEGGLESVFVALPDNGSASRALRGVPSRAPAGAYELEGWPDEIPPDLGSLAWAEGAYRFVKLKTVSAKPAVEAVLSPPPSARAEALSAACALARDLINMPASAMGPADLEEASRSVAIETGAEIDVVRGEALIDRGYPAVHAVGRAAARGREPRMVELSWGDPGKPVVALVGKGVTFDTGGLDLKPSSGMRLMKKDMGGAAHALALARAIMVLDMPVRLSVLLPVVENAVSGEAVRPGDVLNTRKGLTVEVGNTDAEGRLILADALTRATELEPVLTLDLATLTGAARVALGPEVVPFYTEDDELAAEIEAAGQAWADPVWRMPLWPSYAAGLESDVADLKNDPDPWVQAGSIAAALFLKRFAPSTGWAHFDIFGWNPRARPGWPVGAEAQAIRALFGLIESRYAGG